MIKNKKSMFVLLPLLALVLAGCGGNANDPELVEISSVNNVHEIAVGETLQLSATVLPEGAKQDVVWTTESEDVATVSKTGLVTAVSVGEVKIFAASKKVKTIVGQYQLKVNPAEVTPTSVTLTVPGGVTELEFGATLQLSATVLPEGAKQDVEFTSSDTTIAIVSAKGLVTPRKDGKVKITATAKGHEAVKAELNLTILPKEIGDQTELWEAVIATAKADTGFALELLAMPKDTDLTGINYAAAAGVILIPEMTDAQRLAYRAQLVNEEGFEEATDTNGYDVLFAPGDIFSVDPYPSSGGTMGLYLDDSPRASGGGTVTESNWNVVIANLKNATGIDLSALPNPFPNAVYGLVELVDAEENPVGYLVELVGGQFTKAELLAWEALMETLTDDFTTVFDEEGYASFVSKDGKYEVYFGGISDTEQGLIILIL